MPTRRACRCFARDAAAHHAGTAMKNGVAGARMGNGTVCAALNRLPNDKCGADGDRQGAEESVHGAWDQAPKAEIRGWRCAGWRGRDGGADALARLVADSHWSAADVATELAHIRQHLPGVALPHSGVVGAGAGHALQRRVSPDSGKEA